MGNEHENVEISNIGSPNRRVNTAPTVPTQDDAFYQSSKIPESRVSETSNDT